MGITSLLSASLKLSPEWPVISQTKRFLIGYQYNRLRVKKGNEKTPTCL